MVWNLARVGLGMSERGLLKPVFLWREVSGNMTIHLPRAGARHLGVN